MNLKQLLSLLAFLLCAQLPSAQADPSSRVGRISLVSGQVDIRADANSNTVEVRQNWPVTSGNIIDTLRFARAEIRIGSTVLRLDSETELEITQLDDQHFNLRLYYGRVYINVRNPEIARQFQLNTALGRFVLLEPAIVRIDAGIRPDVSSIKLFAGNARFETPGSQILLQAGKQVTFRENETRTSFFERDDFDFWSYARDQAELSSQSARYVSTEITGYEELDRHGDWETHNDYGALWIPRSVPSGWAPYRYGSWTFVRPWGWTWVDQASWGYAPSHYGRWLWFRDRWCWSPGPLHHRPVWAPALVGWVRQPGYIAPHKGSHQGSHNGNVSWYPLSPGQIYQPYYGGSATYIKRLNHGHVYDATLAGRQPFFPPKTNWPNATTTLPENQFGVHQPRKHPHGGQTGLIGPQQPASLPQPAIPANNVRNTMIEPTIPNPPLVQAPAAPMPQPQVQVQPQPQVQPQVQTQVQPQPNPQRPAQQPLVQAPQPLMIQPQQPFPQIVRPRNTVFEQPNPSRNLTVQPQQPAQPQQPQRQPPPQQPQPQQPQPQIQQQPAPSVAPAPSKPAPGRPPPERQEERQRTRFPEMNR